MGFIIYSLTAISASIEAAGYTIFKNITSSANGLGGWPMIQKNWASDKFTWETSAGLSRAFLNQALIFNTYVFLDTFDASTNVIHVSYLHLRPPAPSHHKCIFV
jgi:hypothetical protein